MEEIPDILFNYLKHTAVLIHSGQQHVTATSANHSQVTAFQAQGTWVPSGTQAIDQNGLGVSQLSITVLKCPRLTTFLAAKVHLAQVFRPLK